MQSSNSQDDPYPPLTSFIPIGMATGTLRYTTLSAAYAGSLVIPLVMLILFCPKTFKRSPIFPILIFNLLLGISLAFLTFIEGMQTLNHPLDPINCPLTTSITCLAMLIPILTDTVLVFKLLRLFPAFQYTTLQRIVIVAVPSTLTIPRLVVMALFMIKHKQVITESRSLLQEINLLIKSRLPLIEFTMQLASNSYCSVILLIKASALLHNPTNGTLNETETFRSQIMTQRLKMMLNTMAGSFLIPVCIQIALVCTFARSKDLNVREPIQWTNTFVSLHCAVSATVWSSIGDAIGTNEEQSMNQIRRQSSSVFIPVDHHHHHQQHHHQDELGQMPNLPRKQSRIEIIPKRSQSTINEGDSVEIMPSPYLLTMQNLAKPIPRQTEMQIQRPVYHFSTCRSNSDSNRDFQPSPRLPQPWNENGRWNENRD